MCPRRGQGARFKDTGVSHHPTHPRSQHPPNHLQMQKKDPGGMLRATDVPQAPLLCHAGQRAQMQQKELIHSAWSSLIAHCRGQQDIQPEPFLQAFPTCWKAPVGSSLAGHICSALISSDVLERAVQREVKGPRGQGGSLPCSEKLAQKYRTLFLLFSLFSGCQNTWAGNLPPY